jgi:N4-gp56 family major capsid protein
MAGVTLSTTLSGEFRAHFSKKLLSYAVQNLVLNQFATKAPIPKNSGAKSITMFRWGAPSIADVTALSEGTVPAASTSHQLALSSITKSLAQYGHRVTLTDIMKMTELFDSTSQAVKVTGQNLGLWLDSVMRNVLVGSNLTTSNGSIGSATEGAGTMDNSDVIQEVYGQPVTTQSHTGLNSATTTSVVDCATVLDLVTKLKKNITPELDGGGFAYVCDPAVGRDLRRSTDFVAASTYKDTKNLYTGEIGSIYGARIVEQTNSFIALGSATAADRNVYATSGGNGTGTGKNVYSSILLGGEAFGVPQLSGDNPFSPSVDILDKADKSDPHNQNVIVAAKAYFTALRLNPNYYIRHMVKTAYAL